MTAASAPSSAPSPARRSASATALEHVREWAPPTILFFGVLATWEIVVRAFGIKQFILPSPLAIATTWQTYLPELFAAARYTFVEVIGGLVIGATGGILVGAFTARYAPVRDSLMPFAVAASSVPILAFAPLFNNWFGLDQQLSKAMVAAVLCFFPVMINTVRGLTTVDPLSLELLRSYAAPDSVVFRKLRVPNALPYVFTALRLAVTLATIGAVVGEYFAAPRASLGQYIATYSSFLNFERSWAAIVFACIIGIGLYLLVVLVERLVMPWYGRQAAWSS
jgi:NitT/TauT family transport system permease protein